jgi:hypothetical protein
VFAGFVFFVIGFFNNLVDRRFPFIEIHQPFLLDFGILPPFLPCRNSSARF